MGWHGIPGYLSDWIAFCQHSYTFGREGLLPYFSFTFVKDLYMISIFISRVSLSETAEAEPYVFLECCIKFKKTTTEEGKRICLVNF